MTDDTDAPQILFITGSGRSGSTLLELALASVEGVASAGELRHLWREGILEGGRCGCGEPVPACEYWHRVLRLAGIEDPLVTAHRAVDVGARRLRLRRVPQLLYSRHSPDERWYAELLSRVHGAIAEVTGCRTIVDSSKSPADLALLQAQPELSTLPLHLSRDLRAVLHSSKRSKVQTGAIPPRPMGGSSFGGVVATWAAAQVGARLVARERGLQLDYQAFCADPWHHVVTILEAAGVVVPDEHPLQANHIPADVHHSAWGNPLRFRARDGITIRFDDEWRDRHSGIEDGVAGALNWLVTPGARSARRSPRTPR